MSKVMAELRFGITGIERQMKAIEALTNKTALTVQQQFASAQLGASDAPIAKTALQQAKVNAVLQESAAKQRAITMEAEAQKSSIIAKEELTRTKLAREEAKTRESIAQAEAAKTKQIYMENRLAIFSQNTGTFGDLISRHASWAISGLALYETFSLLKEGIVDVEKGMKGLSTVLPEVHENQAAYNKAQEDAINLMQRYGASLDEVMPSARSFGRMYKDELAVMGLVNNSILMNVVDNVKAEEAVRGNEAALAVYGDELKTVNEILAFSNHTMDAWTRLSHETMASATDLINITERASGSAKVAKTNFDQMMGIGSSAVRATGLPGANIGNMLKTTFAQLAAPTDKVEENIEAIGVKMREANGELRSAYDILLDLSLATKDAKVSQEELANAEKAAASGKFQYSKVAALMGQYDEIVKNTARSINNQGMTLQMATQQMDTVERKVKMLKATLVDMFAGAGDAGLRATLKELIDIVNQFLMGFNRVSKVVINGGLAVGAAVIAWKALKAEWNYILPLTSRLTLMSKGLTAAQAAQAISIVGVSRATAMSKTELLALEGVQAAATVSTGGLTGAFNALKVAFATNPIGLVITALTTLASIALPAVIYGMGRAEKAEQEFSQKVQENTSIHQQQQTQYEDVAAFLESMGNQYDKLTGKLAGMKTGTKEYQETQDALVAVQEAVILATDNDTKSKLGLTDATTGVNKVTGTMIDKIIQLQREHAKAVQRMLENDVALTEQALTNATLRIQAIQNEMAALQGAAIAYGALGQAGGNTGLKILSTVAQAWSDSKKADIDAAKLEADQKAAELAGLRLQVAKLKASEGGGDGGGGGSSDGGSGSSKDTWLEDLIKDAERAAEAQEKLNAAIQRNIDARTIEADFHMKNALTMAEYNQGLEQQKGLLGLMEQKQSGLNTEVGFYEEALSALQNAQESVDTSTEEGSENYDKLGEEMEKVKDKIGSLKKEWYSLEAQQRSTYGSEIKDKLDLLSKLKDLGADTQDLTIQVFSNIDWDKPSLGDKIELLKKNKEVLQDIIDLQAEKQIKAIEAEKEAFKTAQEAKIKSIQDEIDSLDEENEALQQQKELQEAMISMAEAQQALTEAQTKLSNTKNEKNTRVLQNGRWEYIADPKAVKDAQKEVQDAQKALLDAQQSYNDKVEEIQKASLKKQLEEQKESEQKKLDDFNKSHDAEIKAIEKAQKETLEKVASGNAELDTQIATDLKTLEGTFKTGLDLISGNVQSWASQVQGLIQSTLAAANGAGVPTQNLNVPTTVQGSRAIGGPIDKPGLWMLHGGEWITNADQVKAAGGYAGMQALTRAIRTPNIKLLGARNISTTNNTSSVDKSTRIGALTQNFPNVLDKAGVIRAMKQYAG